MPGNDSNTKSLLHFDGANGGTTFTDANAGGGAHTWTANSATTSTGTSKFGTASLACGAAVGWIDTPDSADLTLGSGDWTIDIWFNWNGGSGVRGFLLGQGDSAGSSASSSILVDHFTSNVMRAIISVGAAAVIITGTTAITSAGWHHLAVVASGGNAKLFIDGAQEGSTTSIGGTPNDSANKFSVGRGGEFASLGWNGWIDEFRLSVGIARWTSNFTPPTAMYGIDNSKTVSIAASSSVSFFASRAFLVAVSVTCASAVALSKRGNKIIAVAANAAFSMLKSANKPVSILSSTTTVILKSARKAILISSATTVAVAKRAAKIISISSVSTLQFLKVGRKIVGVSSTSSVSMVRNIANVINIVSEMTVYILNFLSLRPVIARIKTVIKSYSAKTKITGAN